MKPQVAEREAEFWDEDAFPWEKALRLCEAGPDANSGLLLDSLEPLAGARVLDFACGSGITSAWLADRGAMVAALDVSPASIASARRLAEHRGHPTTFVTGEATAASLEGIMFDRLFGQYALHHVGIAAVAPLLADHLADGGWGAFLETMATNPVLNFVRRRLMGIPGVKTLGTPDEHPLTDVDLDLLRSVFGTVAPTVGEMQFARIFDRNVFLHRRPAVKRVAGAIDPDIARSGNTRLSVSPGVVGRPLVVSQCERGDNRVGPTNSRQQPRRCRRLCSAPRAPLSPSRS